MLDRARRIGSLPRRPRRLADRARAGSPPGCRREALQAHTAGARARPDAILLAAPAGAAVVAVNDGTIARVGHTVASVASSAARRHGQHLHVRAPDEHRQGRRVIEAAATRPRGGRRDPRAHRRPHAGHLCSRSGRPAAARPGSTPRRSSRAGSSCGPPGCYRSPRPRQRSAGDGLRRSLAHGQRRRSPLTCSTDPRIQIYGCGREDIRAGAIDRRVLATLEFLAASGFAPTVSVAGVRAFAHDRLGQRLRALDGHRGRHRRDQRHPDPRPPGRGLHHRDRRAAAPHPAGRDEAASDHHADAVPGHRQHVRDGRPRRSHPHRVAAQDPARARAPFPRPTSRTPPSSGRSSLTGSRRPRSPPRPS